MLRILKTRLCQAIKPENELEKHLVELSSCFPCLSQKFSEEPIKS